MEPEDVQVRCSSGADIRLPVPSAPLKRVSSPLSIPGSYDYKVPKRRKMITVLGDTSKDYASSTTAHGFSYIVEDGQSVIERVIWTIVVILAVSFTVFQMTTLYQQWQDDPVLTTLDTAALPIQDIEFPAVTICPQGSISGIMDSVLVKQFKEYIIRKRESGMTRLKRENGEQEKIKQREDASRNLTSDAIMQEMNEFLSEVYPGAKDKPTKLIRLMTANDPAQTLAGDAILKQTDIDECDQDVPEALTKYLYNDPCPEGFEMLQDNSCVHTGPTPMNYDDAKVYCDQQGGAQLLYFESYEAIKAFVGYPITRTYLIVTHYNT